MPLARETRTPTLLALASLLALPGGASPSVTGGRFAPRVDRMGLPARVRWIRERPADLRPVDGSAAGVADLAVAPLCATVTLRGRSVEARARGQALALPPGLLRLPVVRVDTDRLDPPILDDDQRHRLAALVEQVARHEGAGRLQIDFEASRSERAFYRALLDEVRVRLGPDYPLSITALGSWCLQDRWLADLPVDEVVPMFYRLGPRADEVREALTRPLPEPACRGAIGVALDEPPRVPGALLHDGRRVYSFGQPPGPPTRVAR